MQAKRQPAKPSAFGTAGHRRATSNTPTESEASSDHAVAPPATTDSRSQVETHPFSPTLVRRAAAMPPTLPEDAVVTAFGTRLPPEMQRMIKTACAERGIRMQDATYEAFWNWLHQH